MAEFKTSLSKAAVSLHAMKRNPVKKQKKLLKASGLSLKWVRPPSKR